MREIRCIHIDHEPDSPATNQHPDAVRYGPITRGSGALFVDAIGGEPTTEEIEAVLNPPPPPEPSIEQKLEAAGITIPELKAVLGIA